MTHKTWAPFSIIGVLIIIIGAVLLFTGRGDSREGSDEAVRDVVTENRTLVSEEGYQYDMRSAIDAFRSNRDADSLKNFLLEVRVPREYLDFHLSLVGILDNSQTPENALTEINQLTQITPWLQ